MLPVALFADTAVVAQAPPVVPPVVQGSTDVPYPEGALGDAVVVLDVVVAKDGTVARVVVKEGVEPFAEQARRAVLTWHFLPARRGDLAIAADITARVDFDQEVVAAPPATVPSTSPGSAPPTAPVPVEEVNVRGRRHEIGQTTLSAADVREMPGAFGDPFQASALGTPHIEWNYARLNLPEIDGTGFSHEKAVELVLFSIQGAGQLTIEDAHWLGIDTFSDGTFVDFQALGCAWGSPAWYFAWDSATQTWSNGIPVEQCGI